MSFPTINSLSRTLRTDSYVAPPSEPPQQAISSSHTPNTVFTGRPLVEQVDNPLIYWFVTNKRWSKAKKLPAQKILADFAKDLSSMLNNYKKAPELGAPFLTSIFIKTYFELNRGEFFIIDKVQKDSPAKQIICQWRDAMEEFLQTDDPSYTDTAITQTKANLLLTHGSRMLVCGQRMEQVKKWAMKLRTVDTPAIVNTSNSLLILYYLHTGFDAVSASEIAIIDELVDAQIAKLNFIGYADIGKLMQLLGNLTLKYSELNKAKRFNAYTTLIDNLADERAIFKAIRMLDLQAMVATANAATDNSECCLSLARLLQSLAYRSRINSQETKESLNLFQQDLASAVFKMLALQNKFQVKQTRDEASERASTIIECHLLSALIQMHLAQFSLGIRLPSDQRKQFDGSTLKTLLSESFRKSKVTLSETTSHNKGRKKGTANNELSLQQYLSATSQDSTVTSLKQTLLNYLKGMPAQMTPGNRADITPDDLLNSYLKNPYYQINALEVILKEEQICNEIRASASDNKKSSSVDWGKLIFSINLLEDPRLQLIKLSTLDLVCSATKMQTCQSDAFFYYLAGTPDIWKETDVINSYFPLFPMPTSDPLRGEAVRRMINAIPSRQTDGKWKEHILAALDNLLAWDPDPTIWRAVFHRLLTDMGPNGALPQTVMDALFKKISDGPYPKNEGPANTYDVLVLICRIFAQSAPSYKNCANYLDDPTILWMIPQVLFLASTVEDIEDNSIGPLLDVLVKAGPDKTSKIAQELKRIGLPALIFFHPEKLPKLHAVGEKLFPEEYTAYKSLVEEDKPPVEPISKPVDPISKYDEWIHICSNNLQQKSMVTCNAPASSLSTLSQQERIVAQYQQKVDAAIEQSVSTFNGAVELFHKNIKVKPGSRNKEFKTLQRTYKSLFDNNKRNFGDLQKECLKEQQEAAKNEERLNQLSEVYIKAERELNDAFAGVQDALNSRITTLQETRAKKAEEMRQSFEGVQKTLEGGAPIDWPKEEDRINSIKQKALDCLQQGHKPTADDNKHPPLDDKTAQIDNLQATIQKQTEQLRASKKELQAKDKMIADLQKQLFAKQQRSHIEPAVSVKNSRALGKPELQQTIEKQIQQLIDIHGAKTSFIEWNEFVTMEKIKSSYDFYVASPSKQNLEALYTACGMTQSGGKGSHTTYQFVQGNGSTIKNGSQTIAAHNNILKPGAINGGFRQVLDILEYFLQLADPTCPPNHAVSN